MLLTCVPSMSVPLWQRPSPLPGTGAWLLASEAVQEWIHCSSKLLWCHGPRMFTLEDMFSSPMTDGGCSGSRKELSRVSIYHIGILHSSNLLSYVIIIGLLSPTIFWRDELRATF